MKKGFIGPQTVVLIVILAAIFILAPFISRAFSIVPGSPGDGFTLYGFDPNKITPGLWTLKSNVNPSYGIEPNLYGNDFELQFSGGSNKNGVSSSQAAGAIYSKDSFKDLRFRANLDYKGYNSQLLLFILAENTELEAPSYDLTFTLPKEKLLLINVPTIVSQDSNGGGIRAAKGLLEITPKVLSTGNYDISFSGEKIGTYNLTKYGNFKIGFATSSNGFVKITNPRTQPIFDCSTASGGVLVYELFKGERKLSLSSLHYPVQSFCLAHPVVIYDSLQDGTTATAEPYQKIVEGETLTIPETQSWGFFYVAKNDGSILVKCSDDEVLDGSSCRPISGLLSLCTDGEFDVETGRCIVFPDVVNDCPSGYKLAKEGTQYICVYSPDVSIASCPEGFKLQKSSNVYSCVLEADATVSSEGGWFSKIISFFKKIFSFIFGV